MKIVLMFFVFDSLNSKASTENIAWNVGKWKKKSQVPRVKEHFSALKAKTYDSAKLATN